MGSVLLCYFIYLKWKSIAALAAPKNRAWPVMLSCKWLRKVGEAKDMILNDRNYRKVPDNFLATILRTLALSVGVDHNDFHIKTEKLFISWCYLFQDK